jgi:RNA polymerase primary sigma factor
MTTVRSTSTAGSLNSYLHEISGYQTLSREEEARLAGRIREGDPQALARLVQANLRFVVSIAKKYQNRAVSLADLISEGNLGLICAAERFDASRGVKFITYAVWYVKQSIIRAIAEQGHAVRVPSAQAATVIRMAHSAAALTQRLQRTPTQAELRDSVGQTAEEARALLPISQPYLSLDASTENELPPLMERLVDGNGTVPDEEASGLALSEALHSALSSLRIREAEILSLYFGLDGADPMTLEAIADAKGITRERVRQIKLRALARLRNVLELSSLAT